jgi:hypothetical protein
MVECFNSPFWYSICYVSKLWKTCTVSWKVNWLHILYSRPLKIKWEHRTFQHTWPWQYRPENIMCTIMRLIKKIRPKDEVHIYNGFFDSRFRPCFLLWSLGTLYRAVNHRTCKPMWCTINNRFCLKSLWTAHYLRPFKTDTNKQVGSRDNVSGGARFEFRPRHQLLWVRNLTVFLNSHRQVLR